MKILKNKKLVELRHKNNLKQKDISTHLGISLQSYCNKENGLRAFTLEEANLISQLFKLSINEIFFGNDVFKMNTKAII